jgi:hypothetical protein
VQEQGREGSRRETEEFLPLTVDMLRKLRQDLWRDPSVWNRETLDARGVGLAITVGVDSGFRVGNLANTGKKEENSSHQILLGDVRVRTGESEWEKWETFEEGHFGKIRNRQAVKALKIVVWTDKSARARKVRGTVKVIERNTLDERTLLEDLLMWWNKAETKVEDPIFTRYYQGKRRELISKDVSTRVKELAKGFDLPPERYASKSMRVGFASGSKFIGVTDELVKKRGGWSKNSNVPSQYYTKGKETGGLLAWSTGKDLMSVKDVKKMV